MCESAFNLYPQPWRMSSIILRHHGVNPKSTWRKTPEYDYVNNTRSMILQTYIWPNSLLKNWIKSLTPPWRCTSVEGNGKVKGQHVPVNTTNYMGINLRTTLGQMGPDELLSCALGNKEHLSSTILTCWQQENRDKCIFCRQLYHNYWAVLKNAKVRPIFF